MTPDEENRVIENALLILRTRAMKADSLLSPEHVRTYLTVHLSPYEHEVFVAVFLDNRNRVIAIEELFRGSIDGATVHPREVVKTALKYNAAAVIFAHPHPSGVAEPSEADRVITDRLKKILTLVEIRTLDHIVVGGGESVSFAERGLL